MEKHYRQLLNEKAPRILVAALAEYGLKEVPGAGNNPKILAWSQEVGSSVGIDYSKDSIPWCGLFIGVCAVRAGYKPPAICVRAKAWLDFGFKPARAMLADVVVLTRKGGGHVGLYVGETPCGDYYYLLGGNQADEVNIRKFPVSRVAGVRRCPWRVGQPLNIRPVIIDGGGIVSTCEQ